MSQIGQIKLHNVNGARLLYLHNDSFLTNIQILTNVGSAAEEPSYYGMAHILEHMFFKGSKKRPGGISIARAANDIGGKMNAYTTYDHTSYYITVLEDKFSEGLDILTDMYQHPLFLPDEFTKELNPILSEYREKEDDPDSYLMEKALEKYMGSGYHPIIGTEKTILNATVEKLHEFKSKYYGGNNCLISIVGGIDEDSAIKNLEKCLQPLHDTKSPPSVNISFSPGEMIRTKPGIQEAYYYRFYPALPSTHPDRFKQEMMSYMLGGNDSALLYERIREELGMSCYGIYSWIMRYDHFSLLGISCGIAPKELTKMDEEIKSQIDRICNDLADEASLSRARASVLAGLAARSETSAGLGGLISVRILKGEKENPLEKAMTEIKKITTKDILEIAQKTFDKEPFKAVLMPE